MNVDSHNNASRHTDTGWVPSGGSLYFKGPTLQKIILGLGGVPLVYRPAVGGLNKGHDFLRIVSRNIAQPKRAIFTCHKND